MALGVGWACGGDVRKVQLTSLQGGGGESEKMICHVFVVGICPCAPFGSGEGNPHESAHVALPAPCSTGCYIKVWCMARGVYSLSHSPSRGHTILGHTLLCARRRSY